MMLLEKNLITTKLNVITEEIVAEANIIDEVQFDHNTIIELCIE